MMSAAVRCQAKGTGWSWAWLGARWLVGGYFLYSGLAKALEPSEFLKLLRFYDLTTNPLLLNLVAAGLPWFEIFCGLLLILGVGVRGTALVALLLLVPFTAVVWHRALAIQEVTGLAFCAIRFDCGCGPGEVPICRKLLENTVLMALGVCLVAGRRSRWALSHHLPGLGAGNTWSGNRFRTARTDGYSQPHDSQPLRRDSVGTARQREDHRGQHG